MNHDDIMPPLFRWAFDMCVRNTVTLLHDESIFDDKLLFTVKTPSEMLCEWVVLSNNDTSSDNYFRNCIRAICLLKRCIQNSEEIFGKKMVLTLSNITSLIALSIYLDCKWVEDEPLDNDHWIEILNCESSQLLKREVEFFCLLKYDVRVSTAEEVYVQQFLFFSYTNHLFFSKQPHYVPCSAQAGRPPAPPLPPSSENERM